MADEPLHVLQGNPVAVTLVLALDGAPTDPDDPDDVTFRLRHDHEDAVSTYVGTDPEVTHQSDGTYVLALSSPAAGTWVVRGEGSAPVTAPAETMFVVDPSLVIA